MKKFLFIMSLFGVSLFAEPVDLETRIKQLEGIVEYQQRVIDDNNEVILRYKMAIVSKDMEIVDLEKDIATRIERMDELYETITRLYEVNYQYKIRIDRLEHQDVVTVNKGWNLISFTVECYVDVDLWGWKDGKYVKIAAGSVLSKCDGYWYYTEGYERLYPTTVYWYDK